MFETYHRIQESAPSIITTKCMELVTTKQIIGDRRSKRSWRSRATHLAPALQDDAQESVPGADRYWHLDEQLPSTVHSILDDPVYSNGGTEEVLST